MFAIFWGMFLVVAVWGVKRDRGIVLTRKFLLSPISPPFFKDENISLGYELFNVGYETAFDITLHDDLGQALNPVQFHLDILKSNASIQRNVTVRLKRVGNWKELNLPARVSYSIKQGAPITMSYSSIIDPQQTEVFIEPSQGLTEFVTQWTTFCVLAVGPVVLPFVVWQAMRHNNQKLVKMYKKKS